MIRITIDVDTGTLARVTEITSEAAAGTVAQQGGSATIMDAGPAPVIGVDPDAAELSAERGDPASGSDLNAGPGFQFEGLQG